MPIQIRKAERFKSKLRLGLAGPSGSGKTFSALKLAHGLAPKGRVLMIDTERGSGDLYAHLFEYDIITLMPPYKPQNYIDAIKAGMDGAYDVIIIDSLTHAWSDEGGLLDQADKKSQSGNRFTVWAELTPQHRALVNAMLNAPCHVIATVRSKQDYAMEKDEKTGRTSVKKMGMAPVQREGMEYEFTTFFDIDMGHFAKTSKDRTDMFKDEVFAIDEKTGERFNEWLNSGRDNPETALIDKKKKIFGLIKDLGMNPKTPDETKGLILGAIGVELIETNYDLIVEKLIKYREKKLLEATEQKSSSPSGSISPSTVPNVSSAEVIAPPVDQVVPSGTTATLPQPLPMSPEALKLKGLLEASIDDLELDLHWKSIENEQTLTAFERGQLRNVHTMRLEKIKTHVI